MQEISIFDTHPILYICIHDDIISQEFLRGCVSRVLVNYRSIFYCTCARNEIQNLGEQDLPRISHN